MFLTEEQVCSRHATGEQKATADDRQRQFSTLAEGLFWSMQRLWRTGAESPTLWPHIVEIDAAS